MCGGGVAYFAKNYLSLFINFEVRGKKGMKEGVLVIFKKELSIYKFLEGGNVKNAGG